MVVAHVASDDAPGAQFELLRTWGSRIAQGYYLAKPLRAPEMTHLLRAGSIVPGEAAGPGGACAARKVVEISTV